MAKHERDCNARVRRPRSVATLTRRSRVPERERVSSTFMLSSIREAEPCCASFFPSLLLVCYEGKLFFPKLLSRELTRSRPTAYVDRRAASLASVSLWTSYAEDACSGAHHVACDDFRVVLFVFFLVVVFWCLFLSVFAVR